MCNEALLKIFNTMVFPHFTYCCNIWSNPKNAESMKKLSTLQKRAARVILNIRIFQTPSSFMFSQLNWMPLADYFNFRKVILVFKVLHGLMPDYLNVFRYVSEINQRQTRNSNSNLLYVPRTKTEYFKRSFIISGSNMWNSLSENVRMSMSVACFKRNYLREYHHVF